MATVLILEDDAAVRSLVALTLAPTGHRILEARTAQEAHRWFEETDAGINLLITDLNLSNSCSGVRIALEFRSLLPFLRIIVITGDPQSLWADQDAAEFSEIPSDSVLILPKPFGAAALLRAVMRFVAPPMTAGSLR